MHDILPMDVDAERVVLGALMSDETAYGRIAGILDPDDFSVEKHRRVYSAMRDVWDGGSPISAFAVAARLKDSGALDQVGGISYLIDIDGGLGRVVGGEQHAVRVRDKAVLRRAILACQKLINECQTAPDSREVLEAGERVLRDLSAKTVQDRRLMDAGQIIREAGGVDAFLGRSKASVPTPLPGLNDILAGGFRDGELIVIAASTSVGKTALASQIAEYAAHRGIGTGLFSLEMPKEDMLMRVAVLRSGVDGSAVRMNRLTKEQRMAYQAALMDLSSLPLYFDDTAASSVPAIHAAIRRKIATHPIGLVIVDYLQLVEAVGKHGTRAEAVGSLSRGLKIMAGDFGVPVVALSQLSRAANDSSEPELHHLRESGSIEQDANTVMFLWRTCDMETVMTQERIPARISVKKQRNGPLSYVDVMYHKRYLRFEESTGGEDAE